MTHILVQDVSTGFHLLTYFTTGNWEVLYGHAAQSNA